MNQSYQQNPKPTMRTILFLCCSLLFVLALKGQTVDSTKILEGKVFFDPSPTQALRADGVFVTNLRTKYFEISNGLGAFKLAAAKGDTLYFESYLFKNRKIVVNKRLWDKGKLLIHLDENIVELEEVTVNNWSPFLREAMSPDEINASVDRLYDNMGLTGVRGIEVQENVSPLSFADFFPLQPNLGRITQAIRGDLRRKRTLFAFEKREKTVKSVIDYFGEDYFVDELKLPASQIREFTLFCIVSSNLKSIWELRDYLTAQTLMEEKALEYNKRLRTHYGMDKNTKTRASDPSQ